MNTDSYYETPEDDPAVVLEEANLDADNLVGEWAEFAELEVFITPRLDRGGQDVTFILDRVARDGEPLFTGEQEYDSLADLRSWLEQRFPLPVDE